MEHEQICINKLENLHIHIQDYKKLDEILQAINHWNEKEVKEITKMVKAAIKDLNSTPTK